MSTAPLPSYPGDSGDETQDDSSIQQCEEKIATLEDRVAACEQKLGIPSPADEPDELQSSLASTKPFGANAGVSNS